jgi:hypothetical protein
MATKKKPEKKPAVDERKLEQWKKKGESLASAKNSNQWAIGDWILAGLKCFGKGCAYDIAQEATGMMRATLYLFKDTAECFPISTRVRKLSFGHHRLVANNDYTPETRQELLQFAVDNKESVASFAAVLKGLKKHAARRAEKRSHADVAASKVMAACDTLLRNYHFSTLLNKRPSQAVRTEVLDRLKNAISKLSDKVKQMEVAWDTKAKGAGA